MDSMIYLDNNATTQPLPEVVEAMLNALRDGYANPSSVHRFGQTARYAIECARESVAKLLSATPKEIVFTGSGTESINLALRGALGIHRDRRRIVITAVEHSAVMRVTEQLAQEGYEVEQVGVDDQGRIDQAQWEAKLTDDTALASILHANNETGVIFDVQRLGAIAHDRGIPLHVDAVQSAGKMAIDATAWPADLISLSGHKFHGPKGVAALYVRRRTRLLPMILGGNQERKLRGGTENVPGILGMGVAAEIAVRDHTDIAKQVTALRDSLEVGILKNVSIAAVNAQKAERLYNTSNIAFKGLEAEAILILLSEAGICASAGAACSSGSLEPSHVLTSMGLPMERSHGSVRFSLSRFNTIEEVDRVVAALPGLLSRLTKLSSHPSPAVN